MTDTPTKVVHLITLLEFGGAQGNTLHTVEHLNPEKFEAHLWAGKGAYWDDKLKTIPFFTKHPVRYFRSLVRSISPIRDLLALWQLKRAFKKTKPAILHTHSSKAGILGRLAAKWAKVPIIIHTFHGFGFNDQQSPLVRNFYIWLEKTIAAFSTKLIFVSKNNWDLAKKLRIGTEDQFVLIRSGIPIKKIRESADLTAKETVYKKLNIPANAKLVTTIGAFKPQKNLHDFLTAATLIRQQIPEAFFLILGDGELRPALESKVQHLGLTKSLLMPGWRQDATQILSASDVFVMTSLWEGLPRALVEAMILSVPSVCYATDGVMDLLDDKDPALVPQGETSTLAKRVVEILTHKDLAILQSKERAANIGLEFDIDHMVRQQEALYQELLVDNLRRKH